MNEAEILAKFHIEETLYKTELLIEWMKIAGVREFYLAVLELQKQLFTLKQIEAKRKKKHDKESA